MFPCMRFVELEIGGVWLVKPVRHGDHRGYFSETFRRDEFEAAVGRVDFVQDNESLSRRGVVRGLHFQRGPAAQAKLVRVSRGTVLDVAVELSGDNGRQLFVPRGMAHGFAVLSDEAQFQYKVDNVYCPESEATLRFDDAALGIDWRVPREEMVLSDKDLRGVPFSEIVGLL